MHAPKITPEIVLRAYAEGLFPMAEHRDDSSLFWISPEMRGIFPLDGFRVAKRLARTVRSDRFTVTVDTAFRQVMESCAAPAEGREETWINDEILALYTALYASGHAHSVETRLDGELVGGLYGVHLGGAFFGESMFSRISDASKVALVHLVARLKARGILASAVGPDAIRLVTHNDVSRGACAAAADALAEEIEVATAAK